MYCLGIFENVYQARRAVLADLRKHRKNEKQLKSKISQNNVKKKMKSTEIKNKICLLN